MQYRISLIASALLLTCTFSAKAQIYTYTNALTGTYSSIAANTSATGLSRVNGCSAISACPDGYNSSMFNVAATFTVNRSSVQFTITPDAHIQLNISSFSFELRRHPKGPQKFRVAYSTNGGASWINNGSDYVMLTSSTCGTMTAFTWNMPDFVAAGPVIWRIYGFQSVLATGVLQIKNIKVNGTASFVDSDADGFTWDADCDDGNFLINPAVTEICNALDDNCDGNADEGLTTLSYYTDADGDGFGDAVVINTTCGTIPAGFVTDNSDCDDTKWSVNTAGTEVCNGADDNCDGGIDEGVIMYYYEDADSDGSGSPLTWIAACAMPGGYSEDDLDCDDSDPAVNYLADEIENGIDDNCDGYIDTAVSYSGAIIAPLQVPRLMQIEETATAPEIRIYPNPVSDRMQIELTVITNSADIHIIITNAIGNIVYSANAAVNTDLLKETLVLPHDLANGMYRISAIADGERTEGNFILSR